LRQLVFSPQRIIHLLQVQLFWLQTIKDSVAIRFGEQDFHPCDPVSDLHRLKDQLWREAQAEQAFTILRVEQEGVEFLAVTLVDLPIVISDQSHVEEQLHIMLVCLPRSYEMVVGETAFPRLLFQQDLEVHLEIVHTPLESEHL